MEASCTRCFFWGKGRELDAQMFKFVFIGSTINVCPGCVWVSLVFSSTCAQPPEINLTFCAAIEIDPLIDQTDKWGCLPRSMMT